MPTSVIFLKEPGSKFVDSLLAKWSGDGLYYLVEKIVERDEEARRYLVKFEDNSKHWLGAEEIHAQLNFDEILDLPKAEGHIVCCICDGEKSKAPNEILICGICQQGYHFACHLPALDRENPEISNDEAEWVCATCKEIGNYSLNTQPSSSLPSIEIESNDGNNNHAAASEVGAEVEILELKTPSVTVRPKKEKLQQEKVTTTTSIINQKASSSSSQRPLKDSFEKLQQTGGGDNQVSARNIEDMSELGDVLDVARTLGDLDDNVDVVSTSSFVETIISVDEPLKQGVKRDLKPIRIKPPQAKKARKTKVAAAS